MEYLYNPPRPLENPIPRAPLFRLLAYTLLFFGPLATTATAQAPALDFLDGGQPTSELLDPADATFTERLRLRGVRTSPDRHRLLDGILLWALYDR